MLKYLGHPRWEGADGRTHDVPSTRPGALALMLAERGDWLAREALAAQLWPEAAPGEAQHRLRLTLHRCRSLLAQWGVADALQAERSRLRLRLPTDLSTPVAPDHLTSLLQGYRLSGPEVPGFEDWLGQVRHRLAAQASTAGAPPSPPWPSLPPRPIESHHLPGRQAATAWLQAWQRGHQAAALLQGEAGMGKSTLLRHVFPGVPCLVGMALQADFPYRSVCTLLRRHAATLQPLLAPGGPSGALQAHRLDLARLLPEFAPGEALPPLDALTARSRLAEALLLALEALGPWLLVDDLPWCDSASTALLALLAQRGRTRWVAGARPVAADSPLQAQLLLPLRQAGQLAEHHLAGLQAADLAEALGAGSGRAGPGEAAPDWAALARLSGGNPFLAAEWLRQHRALPSTSGGPEGLVPSRLQQLLHDATRALPVPALALLQAAAVLGEAVPETALAEVAGLSTDGLATALPAALAATVLQRTPDGALACRHDLLREHALLTLGAAERRAWHRRAACWWAAQPGADPRTVAHHADQAGDPTLAGPWWHQAARQLKQRGALDDARAIWTRLQATSQDPMLGLLAGLELAATGLFDDLPRSRSALLAVQAQLPGLPPGAARDRLAARACAALVDNGVFSGDLPAAQAQARQLRALLPGLALEDRLEPLEVLIELAMREDDPAECWRLLGELRHGGPQRPQVLSFEGQIHWFTGDIRAALASLCRLRDQHPAFRRGLTIDNDIAVMHQALGQLDEAEAAVQASLQHWAGVPHTEALSRLVLGLVLTSAGRWSEAQAQLEQALDSARAQGATGYEAEAWLRLARMHLLQLALPQAQAALDQATPWMADSAEPLRASHWAWVAARLALAQGELPAAPLRQGLADAAARSRQPLVHLRHLQVVAQSAWQQGDRDAAQAHAIAWQRRAQESGVREAEAEARWLLGRCQGSRTAAEDWARQHGLHGLLWHWRPQA